MQITLSSYKRAATSWGHTASRVCAGHIKTRRIIDNRGRILTTGDKCNVSYRLQKHAQTSLVQK